MMILIYLSLLLLILSSIIDLKSGYVYSVINLTILLINLIINHQFLIHKILISIIFYLLMIMAYYISNKSFGYGDIETLVVLSINLSFINIIKLLFYSNLSALLYVLIYYLLNKKMLKKIAFVPFISIGYIIILLKSHILF